METSAQQGPRVEVAPDPEALAEQSLELFITDAKKAIGAKDLFCAAISGGNTPRRFFELIGQSPRAAQLPWKKIHLFWVDERYVPADSDMSNFKLAVDTFLANVPIPDDNVHPIPTEYSDVKLAAHVYERTIREVFQLAEGAIPRFDLIILGMGPDGHTGSLFPNSYAPFDIEDLACVVYGLDDQVTRITLTHPVMRAASHLAILVSGDEKADILKQVLTSQPDEVRYPIHVLWPILDKVTWIVDTNAAKLIQV